MSTNKGNSIMDDLKSGVKGIHSAGEAIRGTFNESVDHAFNDKTGEAKNHAIANQGVQGVKDTDAHFGTHHGIASNTSTNTGTGLRTGGLTDTTTRTGETTGAGTHSGAPGNLGGSAAAGVNQGATTAAQEDVRTTQRY